MKITVSKTITSLVAVTLFTTFALTNGGAKIASTNTAGAAAVITAQAAASEAPSEATEKDGVSALLKVAKYLSKAAAKGDEDKVKEYGPQLEENWSKIEDQIKVQYPELYDQVENYLNPTVAATQSTSIDKDAILKLDNQLIQVLNELSLKLIPVSQVKNGATLLIGITYDMKKAIDAEDEAKIKEIGPKLEEIWSTFEDGVKPRNAGIYEKIEQSLNPEVAGSQNSVVDKKKLADLNDNLTQTLTELVQGLN